MKKQQHQENETLILQKTNSLLTSYTQKEKYVPSSKTIKTLEKIYKRKVKEKK